MDAGVRGQMMASLSTFVRVGFEELERRSAAVTAPVAVGNPAVARVIAGSRVARALDAVLSFVERVFRRSRAAGVARTLSAAWAGMAWAARRRAVGVTLIVAAAVHTALVLIEARPAGDLWLIVPAIAAVVGLLLTAASFPEARRS